ncbi:hypothetical protein LIER_42077 [Lithospermum erythrorhizon]|uniref:Uncharacterized protein n=1 Tax=Lithospermum erythrorhizon TaxID=34254 RepID=A0AAV3RKP9_LITER
MFLEQQFSQLQMNGFNNVSDYCRELEVLAHQLFDVGAPVSKHRLVLRLLLGLNDDYEHVAASIVKSDPLPPFNEACSRFVFEEIRKPNKQAIYDLSGYAGHHNIQGYATNRDNIKIKTSRSQNRMNGE